MNEIYIAPYSRNLEALGAFMNDFATQGSLRGNAATGSQICHLMIAGPVP